MTQLQRQTDRKREAILQAAITEFRQNGFEATSMDKIAATAAVSKRTVYNHFPSKEELFSAILMQLWQSAITSELVTYAADIDMQQQLEKYLTRKMAMLCDQNFLDLARVAVAATIHAPDRARDMVEKLSKNEPSIVTWIKAAQNDGKLRVVEPTMMADMLLGQIKALAFWPQVAMGQPILTNEQQRALIETAAKMFMQFYST
ncbi:TetR/AcrR family transcriptional regulator [Undibacterium jejuense]|uniref:TetR/AcrR family transcriptional regulator n=1 Tax=Undibacterium jejuense TaxID=1344949 RepID=A0A923HHA5_9BURK|nr:TetR/AcrR family transcriptional regulator [Undibacterium jejuense]MBC3863724.1 TetR/AcrR family transcriptional regulator [Undibacterium jejuense]